MRADIISIKNASRVADLIRKKGRIVFTNGCFDLIHTGHISYLRRAKAIGDFLWIGVNSDSSVRLIKGNNRPIIAELDRIEILSSFRFVDLITLFNDITPLELIKQIKPDILVKGGDYTEETVVGSNFVNYISGKTVILPFVKGKSSTLIIEKIRKLYENS